MLEQKRVILASASPRRREILEDMGLTFEVLPADIDESAVHASSPRLLVKKLSALKAGAMASEGAVVIGADTVVVYGGRVYGKPHTVDNAVKMLGTLCGKWHAVYTGVCVIADGKKHCFCVKSRVKLRAMSRDEIERYAADTRPLDKAGAYGIQDGLLVEKYRGSFTNIVGLPKEKLAGALARVGVRDGNR